MAGMQSDLVSIPSIAPAFLAALGVDWSAVVKRAGVPPPLLRDGKHWVSTRDYFALWNAVQALGVPPDFGVRAGTFRRPEGQYDVASIAALHSRTFADAIEAIARFKRITCPGRWLLETRGAEAALEFRWLLAHGEPVPDFLTDGAFSYVADLYRRGTGRPLALLRIELARRPGHAAMLGAAFGCEVRFNTPQDRMFFGAVTLADPFLTHNQDLLDLIGPGLLQALDQQAAADSPVARARDCIRRFLRGKRPTVEQVAHALHMGTRTLQRKLELAGTSYQDLLDDVRHECACRLLAGTDLDPGEIAFYLGFEEATSFRRAFRGWEKQSPAQWRSARGQPSSEPLRAGA